MLPEMHNSFVSCSQVNACLADMPPKKQEIGCNVPFSIVGATQVPFVARLIARMDQGNNLLDRFLFIYPTQRMLCHGWKANRLSH